MTDYEKWREIERAAREQVSQYLEEAQGQPLTFGDAVAWVTCHYGKTDALSEIHRVQDPDTEEGTTFCGEPLPDPKLRFAPLKSLNICRECRLKWAEALTGLTAKSA